MTTFSHTVFMPEITFGVAITASGSVSVMDTAGHLHLILKAREARQLSDAIADVLDEVPAGGAA